MRDKFFKIVLLMSDIYHHQVLTFTVKVQVQVQVDFILIKPQYRINIVITKQLISRNYQLKDRREHS